jgi:hypothetical protein
VCENLTQKVQAGEELLKYSDVADHAAIAFQTSR